MRFWSGKLATKTNVLPVLYLSASFSVNLKGSVAGVTNPVRGKMSSTKTWFNKLDSRYRLDMLALLLLTLLTVVAARSILFKLDSIIVGYDSDVFINPWADWWTLKAITDPQLSLWETDYLFYPTGASLAYHSFSPLNTWISLMLRPLFGPLVAYNLTMLINLIVTGLAMFQLVRYLTNSASAAFLSAVVYSFNPSNIYQLAHPDLFSIWCFPWLTLYYIRAVRENNRKYALIAALFLGLGTATSILLLILMGIWLLFLTVYLFLAREEQSPSQRVIAIFVGASFLLSLPFLYPLLHSFLIGQDNSFLVLSSNALSTDIISPLLPHWYYWSPRGLYLGILPIFLLLWAKRQGHSTRIWYLLLIVSYLIAIGSQPTFLYQEIGITLPWNAPIAAILRNTYRMLILMSLALAVLVAYGWVTITYDLFATRHRRLIATAFATLFIFGEYVLTLRTLPHIEPRVSTFYTEYLQNVPDDIVLAQIPHGRKEDKRYLYYQTLHGHRIIGGHISRIGEDTFDFINNSQLLRTATILDTSSEEIPFPTDLSYELSLLVETGVDFLIVDKQLLGGLIQKRVQAIPFKPIFEDDLVAVYNTDPQQIGRAHV